VSSRSCLKKVGFGRGYLLSQLVELRGRQRGDGAAKLTCAQFLRGPQSPVEDRGL
jgi:hypothetical protein